MFGVPALVSTRNPILRRSSSKLIDPGSSELGNNVEEGSSFPTEVNEMKTGNSQIHSGVLMPSQIFLWRFKYGDPPTSKVGVLAAHVEILAIVSSIFGWSFPVLLFLIWGCICCKISWDSVMMMSVDLRDLFLYEAFLYYNPLLLVTMMVWLWGVNLWVFAQSSVNYSKIFDLEPTHLTHGDIWKCATWMTIVVPTSMTAYLYLYSHGEVSFAESQPVILYAVVLMILIFPFDIFYLPSRYYLLRTLCRIILPLQAITFSDFFLADILTSMAKIWSVQFAGWSIDCLCIIKFSVPEVYYSDSPFNSLFLLELFVDMVPTIAWLDADPVCGSQSIAIPLVLVFPYMCRFFQCLRQYKDTREKTSLLNALKYSTAVPVISLSALKYHVFPDRWTDVYRPLWLLSSIINSSYSFYWDLTRDWDLSVFSRIFKFKNPNLCSNVLYGRQWVYYWAIGSNLVLRCTWTYKLSAHLRRNFLTVFTITALEMFRRFQWVFFRVENEWNKMTLKLSLQVAMSDIPKEEDRLLDSNNRNV